jgi:alkanesulfonate monooxygenase SsuD/methylene tetrahydromethanopterin reductase-like flavin-dependent oxidoreductase (luciferase family)
MTAVDEDGDRARDRARRSLAFYFSTPSYAAAADETGWGGVAGKIRDTFRERGSDWDTISALVPDEMVAEFCLAGTPDEVLAGWQVLEPEYAARGVSETVFQTVGAGPTGEDNVANLRSIVDVLGRGTTTGRP